MLPSQLAQIFGFLWALIQIYLFIKIYLKLSALSPFIIIFLLKMNISKISKTITIILLLAIFSQTQNTDACCIDDYIQVSGEGRVSAQPDTAVIQIRFNQKGKTSAQAVKTLAAKVNQALALLKASGYGSDTVQTGSLNVSPEYSYINGNSGIIGQRASQSLTVKIRGVDAKGQKVATLVDALAQIDGVNLDSVSFDIYDKTQLQSQSRAAAYKDAKQKAEDYASFAELTLGKVLLIYDTSYVEAPALKVEGTYGAGAGFALEALTSVPVGEQDVIYRTTITFSLR